MAGELVPLVLLPRFSTFVGAGDFVTIGMEVSDYTAASVNTWRGAMLGSSPTFGITFEESTDQGTWTTCSGTTASADPGAGLEAQYVPTLKKRWFRVKVTLGGTNPAATCWAIGYLEMRES
ncbi:MAG: hypothetical protein ACT4PV_10520 [Planctomycetaceae bacterium]